MSFYLVCGQAAAAPPTPGAEHQPTTRPRRYPSDTTDIEWQLIAAYLPAGGTGDHGGRPVVYSRRDIVDAIRYLDHNSCVWRALPVDFPPWPTVYHYFRTWTRDGSSGSLMVSGILGAARSQSVTKCLAGQLGADLEALRSWNRQDQADSG
ncbi:transposase [Catellatospora chokoriensis]|uniref:Insertion element IS402-like domain-containing protein n=1 Tax=Catellatospora chokoriensis TaxID=310353 RepID=A0A8J3K4R5_9ACTN|nr:transposase [Catellatospora chokoriensis]GIF90258.1 hypothetical protein Cch02nite_37020 [Catellatospora chokoriensis]